MREVEKMSKDLMIYFDEEGVAKAYDDTYDITIHCESEEEQQKAIEQLKSLQWIPCSERLPENSDEVLTTYIVNGNKNKRYTETATYYDGDDGYWSSPWDEYRVAGTRIDVIAWMPLPKPYKEDDDE